MDPVKENAEYRTVESTEEEQPRTARTFRDNQENNDFILQLYKTNEPREIDQQDLYLHAK